MKFGDMTFNEAKRHKGIEIENSWLKKIVADLTVDSMMLKEVSAKK
jgi:hypothetical protein